MKNLFCSFFCSSIVGILCFLSAPETVMAQVEIEDVRMSEHPTDTSAVAEYIQRFAWVAFEWTSRGPALVTEYKEIIKVYDTKGEKYGTFKIGLSNDRGDRERIRGIKGTTYNYVNGKVVKTKLDKKDIYEEEYSDRYSYSVWAMPDVRPGSVIEIKYSTTSPWVYTIPRFDFQLEVPVREAEYIIQIPEYLTYTPIATGVTPLEREESSTLGRDGPEARFQFKGRDIPALKGDDYVLDASDYRTSLKYELHSMSIPGRAYETFSKSWADIAKNLLENQKFGKQLKNKLKDYKSFVAGLTDKGDDEIINEVYTYVQEEYTWNEEYGIYCDECLRDLPKKKSGSVSDLNMLLINLLNQAGVEAFPFLLKTRNSGLLNQAYPSLSELNYLLAYIPKEDGTFVLLDATSKYVPVGQLPTRAVNINGLLIQDNSGQILNVPNPNTYSYQGLAQYDIDVANVALVGRGKSIRKNYGATDYRIDLAEGDDDEEEEEGEEDDGEEEEEEDDEEEEITLENESETISAEGIDDIDAPIKLEFEEKLYDVIDIVGGQIFINSTLDFGMDENPFVTDERVMPIFYNSLQRISNTATINIPEGYTVESMPEPVNMTLQDRSISFNYAANALGGKISITYVFKVNNDIYTSEIYPDLKEIYERVVEKSKEKIVLKKA